MNHAKTALLTVIVMACLAGAPITAYAEGNVEKAEPAPNGSLVLFLTRTDPMTAGHGLHIARRMLEEDRGVTVVLTGAAGQIAVKGAATNASSLTGDSLQEDLAAFIAAGGTVAITPPTVAALGVDYDDLIEGVGPPKDHRALHDHMFEPRTKLMAF